MKLQLSQEWYEKHIQPDENFEVGAGMPPETRECADETSDNDQKQVTEAERVARTELVKFLGTQKDE